MSLNENIVLINTFFANGIISFFIVVVLYGILDIFSKFLRLLIDRKSVDYIEKDMKYQRYLRSIRDDKTGDDYD